MLAHIRNNEIIKRYPSEKGWIILENGDKTSPPVAGYINGNDKIVPFEEVTIDNSTTSRTKSSVVETVEANRVLRTKTIVDDPVTTDEINIERDRRINDLKQVSLTSGKTFPVDMSNGGRENVDSLGAVALAKLQLGLDTTVSFRDANNQDWDLTNQDLLEMGIQIASQVEDIHIYTRLLKAMNPIPLDYTDDSYWS